MKNIKTWSKRTVEYRKLTLLKCLLDIFIAEYFLPIYLKVEDVYYDYGQGWIWTTIVAYRTNSDTSITSWQLLNPARHEKIVFGDIDNIIKIGNDIKKEFLERYKEEN